MRRLNAILCSIVICSSSYLPILSLCKDEELKSYSIPFTADVNIVYSDAGIGNHYDVEMRYDISTSDDGFVTIDIISNQTFRSNPDVFNLNCSSCAVTITAKNSNDTDILLPYWHKRNKIVEVGAPIINEVELDGYGTIEQIRPYLAFTDHGFCYSELWCFGATKYVQINENDILGTITIMPEI